MDACESEVRQIQTSRPATATPCDSNIRHVLLRQEACVTVEFSAVHAYSVLASPDSSYSILAAALQAIVVRFRQHWLVEKPQVR